MTVAPAKPSPGVVERARARVHAAGLTAWRRPAGPDGRALEPRLPPDLTALTDQAVGRLWTEFCAFVQFAKGVHALHAVEAAEAARADRLLRARVYLEQDATSREARAAAAEADPRVAASGEALAVADATRELSYAVYEGANVGREAVSREMTRRIELERHRGVGLDPPSRR